jgi:hypothetical protein
MLVSKMTRPALSWAIGITEAMSDRCADLVRTLRFLQGRAEFRAHDDDIYIASYPRSGTTLTQFLVYLLLGNDELEFDHISQLTPWFERSLALGRATARDFEDVRRPRIFKTHLPYGWLPRRGRCIYVTRDGRDVALSYYHLYRNYLGFTDDFEAFFERFISGKVQYGSWFKHVAGWRKQRDNARVLFVSYRELIDDKAATARKLASFLGTALDDVRLQRVISLTSFESMKEREAQFDHATDLLIGRGVQRGRFLRAGKVGQGQARLDAQQARRFEQTLARPQRLAEVELSLSRFLH